MALSHSPKIITDGLILYLDAANPKCFISGNTTCNNIITNGLVTGANGTPGSGTHTSSSSNFPSYNSIYGGIFDFAGGKGMNCEENLGNHTSISLCVWIYKNNTGSQYITDARNNGGQWFLSNYSSYNITYTNALTYNFDGTYNSAHPGFINKWLFLVATSDSSGSNLYLNGKEVIGGSRNSVDEDLGKNFRIGTRYTTSSEWTGFMGPIFAYNYVLSETEVKQNFNALRGRFGI